MAKYHEFNHQVFVSDANVTIITTFGSTTISDVIANDGSMDANYKTKVAAHRAAVLSLPASSTSPACYVSSHGGWNKMQASSTITTSAVEIKVPVGNSGILEFSLDTTAATVEYKINSGSYVTLTDGGTATVTDGQTITIKVTSLAGQNFVNGAVIDQDTVVLVDEFSILNSTP